MQKVILMVMALSALANAQTKISSEKYSEDLCRLSLTSSNFMDGSKSLPLSDKFNSPSLSRSDSRSMPLTGILSNDLFTQDSSIGTKDSVAQLETHSALTSGFFSLVIPGAGQAYNGNLIKAASFFAVEVAGWIVNTAWNKKGNDETNFFRTYADGTAANHYQDGHYNVYRYAQYIVNNYKQLEQSNGISADNQTIVSQQINYVLETKTYDPTRAPWVQVNWDALNKVENALSGGYFSHWLFPYGDVEYYKEIAKYDQFISGWEDATASNGWQLGDVTPLSTYYEGLRSKATGYYNVALAGLCVIIANHFASAVEAAIWAHGHNKVIETSVGVAPVPLEGAGYQTQFNLAVNF